MNCPYCGRTAERVTGERVYPRRPDLHSKRFILCVPCDAYVGCHADGKPFGTLAKATLRRLRSQAHAAFDVIWRSGEMERSEAYRWLREAMMMTEDECHIGMMDEKDCARVIDLSRAYR